MIEQECGSCGRKYDLSEISARESMRIADLGVCLSDDCVGREEILSRSEDEFRLLRELFAALFKGEVQPDEVAIKLNSALSKRASIAILIEARQRGWITNAQLGINDEGGLV